MTLMDASRDESRAQYEAMLATIKPEGGKVSMADHPGAKYLSTGFGEGFNHGYRTNAAAAHAALSVVIGELDAGLIDVPVAKVKLIQLRDTIKDAAGL